MITVIVTLTLVLSRQGRGYLGPIDCHVPINRDSIGTASKDKGRVEIASARQVGARKDNVRVSSRGPTGARGGDVV